MKDKLKRFEMLPALGDDLFYPTLGAAVDAYVAAFEVVWN